MELSTPIKLKGNAYAILGANTIRMTREEGKQTHTHPRISIHHPTDIQAQIEEKEQTNDESYFAYRTQVPTR
jgi:hypothetical protein